MLLIRSIECKEEQSDKWRSGFTSFSVLPSKSVAESHLETSGVKNLSKWTSSIRKISNFYSLLIYIFDWIYVLCTPLHLNEQLLLLITL